MGETMTREELAAWMEAQAGLARRLRERASLLKDTGWPGGEDHETADLIEEAAAALEGDKP
jgi:hypothetical protein